MKKLILFLIVYGNSFLTMAQNLVSNPGFETYLTCPAFGQFSNVFIQDWNKPTVGSSDYYHYNCPGITPQQQAPRTGEAYSGIIGYNYGTEYREYITGTLISPLVAGYLYDVDFYVSLNDGYIQAIEELGAYLSVTPPGPFPNALHLNLVPQVEHNNGTITDTTGWKHVYGQFMASGGEQYITIGNFHDDAGTTITQPGTTGSYGAYYFVDDVSVTLADSTTGISENPAAGFFVSYQNGALQIAIEPGVAGRMEIHDMSGRLVFIKENVSGIVNANLPAISGIYTVSLLTENKIYHRKISRPALK